MKMSILVITTLLTATVVACPFCDAPVLTMAEQVDLSAHLVLAKWIGGEKPTDETNGDARFEIVKIAKSEGDVFQIGDEIVLPRYYAFENDIHYSLMGADTRFIDWPTPNATSEDAWAYMSGLPLPETEQSAKIKRLAYFIDYLQHPDTAVANDAYGEFASAPYELIQPLKDQLPREKLRTWLADRNSPVTRTGLYGLLLGLCGRDEDAAVMQQLIDKPGDFMMGIEGVMSGYVLIRGEAGLRYLEDTKMKTRTYINEEGVEKPLKFSQIHATMQVLRFFWTYEPDKFSKDRLRQSMRHLLMHPEMADLVITDLARWKDWSLLSRLKKMYSDPNFDTPSTKRSIVRYCIYATRDTGEDEGNPSAHVAEAKEMLKEIEIQDPKIHRDAIRFMH